MPYRYRNLVNLNFQPPTSNLQLPTSQTGPFKVAQATTRYSLLLAQAMAEIANYILLIIRNSQAI